MSFDWFLILLPVVLAIGALIKVLTAKPPAYQRKDRAHYDTSGSDGGSGISIDIDHSSSPGKQKPDGDAPDTSSDSGGGDGGGGGD